MIPRRRTRFILTIVTVLAIVAAAQVLWGGRGTPARRPNVLIVSLDTVRADRMGFHGFRLPDGTSPTPNLDRFAVGCAAMQEGLTPAPLTLPAHVSLLSGLYPDRHGVRENDSFSVPEAGDRPFSLLAEDLSGAGWTCGAFVSGQPLERRYGLDAGFRVYDDTGEQENPVDRLRFRERPGRDTVDRAIRWLGGTEAPFFLFVHLFDAHDPYTWHGAHGGLDSRKRDHRYLSEIVELDRQVGRLLAALPDGGEDTLVIVLSDHGEGLGEHGEQTHGFTLHESTLRVPFLLKAPAGVDTSALGTAGPPSRLIDVYPTVLAVAGVDAGTSDFRDGRNLLAPPEEDWHAFSETLYPWYQFQYAHRKSCRDRSHKLVTGGTRKSLFSWQSDPLEMDDLVTEEPEKLRELEHWIEWHVSRPRATATDVIVQPSAHVPYMGGRSGGMPLEPDGQRNETLPVVEDQWDVVNALDRARALLRSPQRNPHEAAFVLAQATQRDPDQLKSNPALLWWTARAAQWSGRDRTLSVPSRLAALDRAHEFYLRHHRTFRDGRAFDAALGVLLDRQQIIEGRELLQRVEKEATVEIDLGRKRALTLFIRADAREKLGHPDRALEDFREAARLESDPVRKRKSLRRIEALRGGGRTGRGK